MPSRELTDDVNAIRLAKTELREAYRSGNVGRVLSVFSDGLGDLTSGCPSFWGPEAKAVLRHRLGKLFTRYRAQLRITIISIRVQGSWAFDWGWHQLTLTPKKGGRPTTTRTRYLEIWAKEADGKWRIAIFLDNPDVKPQMPPAPVLRLLNARPVPKGPRRIKRVRRVVA